MWEFITGPYFWISIGVIFLAIIVISFIVSKRREHEVAELEKMFPGNVIDTSEKIPVEKVRRSTARRRKQSSAQTTRESPRRSKEMNTENQKDLSDTSPFLPQLDPEIKEEPQPTTSKRRFRRQGLPTLGEKPKKMSTGSEFTTSSLLSRKRTAKKEYPTQTLSRSSRKSPLKKDSLLDETSTPYPSRRSRFPRT